VLNEQNDPHPDRTRRASAGRLRAQLSFANVAAGLALFIALGGTAAAAVTLDRDSVGSPQIRSDAVRSPEIVSGAVRSSEIRDGGIKVADVADGAQNALRGEVRLAEDDNDAGGDPVPRCATQPLDCPDLLVLGLSSGAGARTAPQNPVEQIPGSPVTEPDRNWLVQAKLEVAVNNGVGHQGATCGLVNSLATGPAAVLDQAALLADPNESLIEQITLSAVVKKRAGNPTIALRCTSPDGNEVIAANAKLVALETGTVTGP
jgi:hypothetical protein